jgi:glycosyltransferase involved in cell wall biosynthesis
LGNAGKLVSEGMTGSKFTADSPEELVQAIRRLLDYENIYQSTYSTYEHLYSEENNYARLMEVYQNAQIEAKTKGEQNERFLHSSASSGN